MPRSDECIRNKTMTEVKSRGVKVRNVFVTAGVVLAVFVPIWFLAAAFGTKFGAWTWQVGLLKMVGGIGVPLIGLLVLVTFITSLLVVFIKPRAGFGGLAAMWLVSLCAAGLALNVISSAKGVPPIHDISTDTAKPLSFSAKTMAARGNNSNPVLAPNEATVPFNREKLNDWSGRSLVEIQADAYPNVKPLVIEGQAPTAIYAKALVVAKSQGFKIASEDAATMRIDAVAESFWFGFKDDLTVAITPIANGAQVDVRSVSRVGISDLGANAKRIEAFLVAVKS
jgi:uncharacterized protein (DUF1499 family)